MTEQAKHEGETASTSTTRQSSDPRRIGIAVFVVLMGLVLLEYLIAIVMDRNFAVMIVMNVIDAAIIMYYFMHVTRLWRSGREEG